MPKLGLHLCRLKICNQLPELNANLTHDLRPLQVNMNDDSPKKIYICLSAKSTTLYYSTLVLNALPTTCILSGMYDFYNAVYCYKII